MVAIPSPDPFLRTAQQDKGGCPICFGSGRVPSVTSSTFTTRCPECDRVAALLRQQADKSRLETLNEVTTELAKSLDIYRARERIAVLREQS